jgi:hypothetical protein
MLSNAPRELFNAHKDAIALRDPAQASADLTPRQMAK